MTNWTSNVTGTRRDRRAHPKPATGFFVVALLFVALLAAAFAPGLGELDNERPVLEPPQAQRQIEDWRGNSASFRPAAERAAPAH